MFKNNSFFLVLLCLFLFVAPHTSWAVAPATAPDCTAASQFSQDYVQNMNIQVQAQTDRIFGIHNAFSKIRTDAFSCLDGINAMFGLSRGMHDPLGFVESALDAAFWNYVINAADAICAAALSSINSVINQVTDFAESIQNFACIPLPSLGFSGPNINLHLPHIPCNGTSLLPPNAIFTPNTTNSPNISTWQFLGRDPL